MLKKIFSLLSLCLLVSLASAQLNTSLFNAAALTEPISIVNCNLENGSSTQCYQLKFLANVVDDDGPFCPATINDVGGMAIYEPGTAGTNVGLSAIDATLLNIIEGDGFDIVQPNGNVNINVPGPGGSMPIPGTSYCLQANKDDDLELVYLIPVTPENLATPNTIETVEQLGVSLDGIPFKGNPPAVIGGGPGGGGNDVLMPALDRCGGHHDPGGYYHWHLIANSTNELLSDLNITSISCTGFPQNPSAIMGYAMDGYPIYGQFESGTTLPTGLDQCNGHTAATNEYPNGIYHYHAQQGVAPNIPPCLTGASANNNFSYNFYNNTAIDPSTGAADPSTVFPNPTQGDRVEIHTPADELHLIDPLGRRVMHRGIIHKTPEGFTIHTLHLPAGMYHVVLIKGAFRTTEKLIIGRR